MYIKRNNSIIYPDSFTSKTNQNKKECNKPSENKDYTNNIMMVLPMPNETLKQINYKDKEIEVIISFPKENEDFEVIKQEVNIILHNALHEYLRNIS